MHQVYHWLNVIAITFWLIVFVMLVGMLIATLVKLFNKLTK